MWIFPLAATMVSAFFSGIVLRLYLLRRNPAHLAWSFALFLFGLGTACDFLASVGNWTPLIAKTYYVTGAMIVVGYLALGTLYLLAPRLIARIWLVIMAVLSIMAVFLVARAGVDTSILHSPDQPGWQAIDRSAAIKAIMITINGLGTLIIVGGAGYSAIRGRYARANILIALGTLLVAGAGSMTALGSAEFNSIGQAAGITVMFAGFLMTMAARSRRDEAAPGDAAGEPVGADAGGDAVLAKTAEASASETL
ncbi:MAG: hypothetical protein M1539_05175 [Actinobacteria bacterium]|nr:hypothetical protein [Actinomycetota bacterium]MCL5883351.1 hypothetical protein [Actinomycetota bacterium]